MYLGYQNGKIKFYTEKLLDKDMYGLDKVEETQQEYVLSVNNQYESEYILKPDDWEEKQMQKERERINKLFLTAADVERALYKAKNMDFNDIIEYVTSKPPKDLDIKALKIELKANKFYRGNPYVEKIAQLFSINNEQLDKFFETGDYKELLGEQK